MSSEAIVDLHHALRQRYAAIESSVEARSRSVAMVVRVAAGRKVEGFGSGFFFSKDGWPFFITAKHVLDDCRQSIQRGEGAFLITRGRKPVVSLESSEHFTFDDLDLAIAPMWRKKSSSYEHFDCWTCRDVVAPRTASSLLFTGFPASRNGTHAGCEVKPHQRLITLDAPPILRPTDVSPFFKVPIEERSLHTSDLKRANLSFPQSLAGMSGGPVLEIRGDIRQVVLSLCGMGVAWRSDKTLKILRFDLVDSLLTHYFSW